MDLDPNSQLPLGTLNLEPKTHGELQLGSLLVVSATGLRFLPELLGLYDVHHVDLGW